MSVKSQNDKLFESEYAGFDFHFMTVSSITKPRRLQAQRRFEERAKVEERERASSDLFWPISAYLLEIVQERGLGSRLTKPIVVSLAREMSVAKVIPLDRMAIRYRSCAICWFCEVWKCLGILPNRMAQEFLQQDELQEDFDWVTESAQ
jgi:hypothetical protein